MKKMAKARILLDRRSLSRRTFLRAAGASAAAGLLGACTGTGGSGGAGRRVIKIGYVSPQTGPLAGFGEADNFVLRDVRSVLKELSVGGRSYPVEIAVKDSQSDPNRAAQVAADLILKDGIDLMVVASTPETTNPVADQCEVNGVPCLSTVAPWQPYFFGRKGDPARPFKWTYHFFWGLEDIIAVFLDMWGQLETNRVAAGLFPNDGDGNAWGDAERGFPGPLAKAGYRMVDPGRYQNLSDDFSAQIAQYKKAGAQVLTGVPLPPDFTTFWKQARQQGFAPKIASVGKALLFPASVEALGELGDGLSTEVWWSPSHPFKSSLTGKTAAEVTAAYTAATGKQWTQPIGFVHALFEVAADALRRAARVDDKPAIAEAVRATDLDTLVGKIAWKNGPVPNVAKTPLVGGQWGKGKRFPFELAIVSNATAPVIPVAGKLRPIPA
jgi:branched-chain amino acid transport system substrate-binding protein